MTGNKPRPNRYETRSNVIGPGPSNITTATVSTATTSTVTSTIASTSCTFSTASTTSKRPKPCVDFMTSPLVADTSEANSSDKISGISTEESDREEEPIHEALSIFPGKKVKKQTKKPIEEDKLSEITKELKQLRTRLKKAENKLQVQETATGVFGDFKKKVELEESRGRRNNIVVHGLSVKKGSVEQSVTDFLASKLDLLTGEVQVKSTRCLGNPTNGVVPILVSFAEFEHKLMVFRNCHLLRGEPISITDDLTDAEREQRKRLLPVLKVLKAQGKKVRFRGPDLYVDDVKHNV